MAIAIAAFLLIFNWADARVAFGQKRPDAQAVRSTASVEPAGSEKERAAAFGAAARKNAALKDSLKWTFGGRQQTGWYLYVPLISHTIGTESAPETARFALALSVWEKQNGLAPDGVLDAETLMAFVKYWQSRRIPKIVEADSSLLLKAPIADFFDPTRSPDLLYVERETYKAYKKMIEAAAKDLGLKIENGSLTGADNFLKIISAHRSSAYQAALRKKEPGAGRAQLAFRSPHFTGRALDIYVGGEPVTTKDENRRLQIETKAYRWLVKNAERFGFYPYFYEPWHWEYVGEKVRAEK